MVQININVDEQLKHDMDTIANDLGLTTTDALRVFMKRFVANRGFPFEVIQNEKPCYNEQTMQAMYEARNRIGLKSAKSIEDMYAVWSAEDENS